MNQSFGIKVSLCLVWILSKYCSYAFLSDIICSFLFPFSNSKMKSRQYEKLWWLKFEWFVLFFKMKTAIPIKFDPNHIPHPEKPLYRTASVFMKTFECPTLITLETIPLSIVGITTSTLWKILGEKLYLPNPKARIGYPTSFSSSTFMRNDVPFYICAVWFLTRSLSKIFTTTTSTLPWPTLETWPILSSW